MITPKVIGWISLAFAIVANVVSNSSIKAAVLRAPSELGLRYFVQILSEPRFWIGAACAGIVLGLYTVAIRSIPVSVAYMTITSMAMVGLVLVDKTVFDVAIGTARIFGMFLIISGVWLVSRGV